MRGKPLSLPVLLQHTRITPADAGKTYTPAFVVNQTQDHPRGCGENLSHIQSQFQNIGSPPRMRGKRIKLNKTDKYHRITPADAGKTAVLSRLYGERGGSPPRMRGKHGLASAPTAVTGITPADAGKTFDRVPPVRARWDHPRGCGENRLDIISSGQR